MGIKDWFGGDKKKAALRDKVKEAVSDGRLDTDDLKAIEEARRSLDVTPAADDKTIFRREIYNEAADAVRQDGKNPYFQKGLGQAYLATKKFDEAISSFRHALELNPYYVDVRNDLGTALVLSGRRTEGKNEFLAAYNDPTNPTPEISSRNLGNAYLEEKRYADAINWYRTSLSRNKAYPDPYLGLSDALAGLGRIDEAVATLETAAKVEEPAR